MKNAVKQMLLFTLLLNVIGGGGMLLSDYVLPEAIGESLEVYFMFVWPVIAIVLYIVFDLKLDIDETYRFTERLLIYIGLMVIWLVLTWLLNTQLIWLVDEGPLAVTEDPFMRYYAETMMYSLMFMFVWIGVAIAIGVSFIVRSMIGLCKRKR